MIKSLLTKGILNDGKIEIVNHYELPLNIALGITELDLDILMDREVIMNLTINNNDTDIDII